MKILLLILLFTNIAFGAGWVKESAIKNPLKMWTKQNKCEVQESQPCFEISGKDVRRWKKGFRSIDINFTNDCDDAADCQSKINVPAQFSCDNEMPTFDNKANWPALDFVAEGRLATGWFLWCQKEVLVVDSAGSAQADIDDAQKATDNATRTTKAGERKTGADTCVAAVNAGGVLASPDLQNCINVLVKQLFENQIAPGDL